MVIFELRHSTHSYPKSLPCVLCGLKSCIFLNSGYGLSFLSTAFQECKNKKIPETTGNLLFEKLKRNPFITLHSRTTEMNTRLHHGKASA